MSGSDVQARIDDSWKIYDENRRPLHNALRELVRDLEAVTGLPPSPGAERLIQGFLDFIEQHHEELATAAQAKTDALVAQSERDDQTAQEVAARADEPQPEPASILVGMPEEITRDWLRNANDADVTLELNRIPDTQERLDRATELYGWVRIDGGLAQVLAAINAVIALAQAELKVGPGHESDIEASDDEVPAGDDVAELRAWVGDDQPRARAAYDAENDHEGGARPEVLSFLVDILDQPHVAPAPGDEPAPKASKAPKDEPYPDAGDTDVEAVKAWVGTDPVRAQAAHDIEGARADGGRPEVFAFLTEVASPAK